MQIVFPIALLAPLPGGLRFTAFGGSIDIPLSPFMLPGHGRVETNLRLDGIALPARDPSALAGRDFAFPRNPAPGFIDGSIYIGGAHHPVDVTRISFRRAAGDMLRAYFDTMLIFSFEGLAADGGGNYSDARWGFETTIAFIPGEPGAK